MADLPEHLTTLPAWSPPIPLPAGIEARRGRPTEDPYEIVALIHTASGKEVQVNAEGFDNDPEFVLLQLQKKLPKEN